MSTTITVAMFDLDDTLFAHRAAVDAGITEELDTKVDGFDVVEASKRWHELEELHYPRYLSGELTLLEQRRIRSRAFVAAYGIDLTTDEQATAWYDAFAVFYRKAWRLFDDAIESLDRVRAAGIRVGMITNGPRNSQQDKIDDLGLGPHLEEIIASGEVGVAKPAARIFEIACERFGVPASEALYVGDRLEVDAIAAQRAGLTGVWLNRSGVTTPEQDALIAASGIQVVTSLTELADELCATA